MRSTVFILTLFLAACLSCNKSTKESGSFIYIEVEDMDPTLEKCFSDKLYDKWASLEELTPHEPSEKYTGQKPQDKHIFKSYDDFDMDKDKAGTIKIMVTTYGDGDTATTFFHLRRFELEAEGLWTQTLNLGNFRVQDRPNDQINPGQVDEEEICDMMVRFAIKASFK